MHPEKIPIWCGFWSVGIIGPYFLRDAANCNVTLNGERYREMLSSSIFSKMQEFDLPDMWFQQDGAICHTAPVTMLLLRGEFDEHFTLR